MSPGAPPLMLPTPSRSFAAVAAYRSLPVFTGGGISTVALSVTLALNLRQPALIVWAVVEIVLFIARLLEAALGNGSRAKPPVVPPATIEVVSALSIGLGTTAAILSGSALASGLGWIAAAAFAGETSHRNLAHPRLAIVLIGAGCLPQVTLGLLSGITLLNIAGALLALFSVTMIQSSIALHRLIETSVRAGRDSDYQARHDRLTGLLNRTGLERELELMRRDQPRADLTLFFVDLDRFKQVNDTLGHAMGDRLLRAVAEQLLELAGTRNIVARFGGDEFVLVASLGLVRDNEFGAAILSAIRKACIQTDLTIEISASIGISRITGEETDLDEFLRTADAKLYEAKRSGGGRWTSEASPASSR